MTRTFQRLVALTVILLPAAPAVAASTSIFLTNTPYTSLDGGATQTVAPTGIVDNSNGSKSATQVGGQSDFFTFGPGQSQSFSGIASVNTKAFADFGTLRLQTYAAASASPIAYGPPFVIGTNPFYPVAYTTLGTQFSDAITVTHPTLPQGAPVRFRYLLDVDSTLFGNSQAILRYSLGSAVNVFVSRGEGIPFGFGDNYVADLSIDAAVGDQLSFYVQLGSGGVASAGYVAGRELDSTDFNAFNTARLNLYPITPGLVLVSDSGRDYAAIPEPSAAVVLAGALLSLRLRTRHK